jgi:hypothetical protein
MDLSRVVWKNVCCTNLAEDTDEWPALVNMVTTFMFRNIETSRLAEELLALKKDPASWS